MLTSPYLVLDGDESIVGIMAKHLYDGKDVPLYFYGQQYGFSLIEELFILPFYVAMGMTGMAVKLAMLSLWTIGVVFFYKTLCRFNTRYIWLSFLLTILLIVSPAWTEWSMKARGGYVSAFTLSAIALYWLTDTGKKKLWYYAVVGLLLVLVYECMPLWLPVLILMTGNKLRKDFGIAKLIVLIGTIALPEIALHIYKSGLYTVHETDKVLPVSEWLNNLSRVPDFIYTSLHGYHYFYTVIQPGMFQQVFAIIFIGLMTVSILTGLYLVFKQKDERAFTLIFLLSLFAGLAVTLMNEHANYRLLLPLTILTILLLQSIMNRLQLKPYVTIPLLAVMTLTGIGSLITFRDFKFTAVTADAAIRTGDYMVKNGIKYAYSGHIYLGWQLMFYAQEKVICRDVSKLGRMPAYSLRIDEALKNGERTALIGMKDDYYGMNVQQPVFIDLIYVKPDMPLSELSKAFAIAP